MTNLNDRSTFLNTAALLEGILVALSFGLGWLIRLDPLAEFRPNLQAVAIGILCAVPLWLLFALSYHLPFGPLTRIKRLLIEVLGPPLSVCRWYDLILLSLFVGFSEELLFRGLLQPWIERAGGTLPGILGSNLMFGLAHAVTPLYAAVAGLMGVYLSWVLDIGRQRNLVTPMVTHAVYDYAAFLVVARSFRQNSDR